MQKKKIILSIIIGIILIGIIGIFIFLYYEFEKSEDDYPITSVRSFGKYDHPPGLNKLPLDTDTEIETMKKQIPQLIEVEEVKKGKVRFKVQWSDLYYKYDFSDWYQIQYAENKEFEDATIKEVPETKKIKAKEGYITLKKLKKDIYYIRLRGGKDYGDNKKSNDIHYTQWSEVYEIRLR